MKTSGTRPEKVRQQNYCCADLKTFKIQTRGMNKGLELTKSCFVPDSLSFIESFTGFKWFLKSRQV